MCNPAITVIYCISVNKKVIKRTGTVVSFDEKILEQSLRRAGASNMTARRIANEIENTITDGDTTDEIYRRAFSMLSEESKNVAMRYSLKKALFGFGPTGFPFEKFIAELFRRKGYATTNNVHLQGSCIGHEVDVLTTDPERIAMEVKFHNDMRIRSDVKSVLYVKARFDDLTGRTHRTFIPTRGAVERCILVTNTKFTKSAIKYANCAGVQLLGWGYPYRENLQTYIKQTDAHPVTCLPSVTASVGKNLFAKGIVTCRGLLEQKSVVRSFQNSDNLIAEAGMVCSAPVLDDDG